MTKKTRQRKKRVHMRKLATDCLIAADNSTSTLMVNSHFRAVVMVITASIAALISTLNVKAQSAPAATQNLREPKGVSAIAANSAALADKREKTDRDKDAKDTSALIEEMRQMRQTIERLEMRVNQLEAEKRGVESTNAIVAGRGPADTTITAPWHTVNQAGRRSAGLSASEAAPSAAGSPAEVTLALEKQNVHEDHAA